MTTNPYASRRNVLLGGLAAASTLAPFPNAARAAQAPDMIRPAIGPGAGVQKASFISSRDGTGIYYKDWGQGRPVVLSHGWPLNADVWDATLKVYAGAPHGLTVTHQDRFNEDLLGFVTGLG